MLHLICVILWEELCWKICKKNCPFTYVVKPAQRPCCAELALSAGFQLALCLLYLPCPLGSAAVP